jgi:parallel beta-helix repeat protein
MRISSRTSIVSFALAAMVVLSAPVYAQKVITQAKVTAGSFTPGDAPGFPLTISQKGGYKLTGNLVVPDANTTAIEVTADNVTLDLNGFGIYGPGGVGTGDGVIANNSNVTVMNGSVRGMGRVGLYLRGNTHRVENMYVTANGYSGIGVGGNSVVRGSSVILNNASGVSLAAIVTLGGSGSGSSITNNVVSSNTGAGIYANPGTTVTGNTVRGNAGFGLWLDNAAYGNNVVSGNNGGGVQVSGGIQMGPNVCNTFAC